MPTLPDSRSIGSSAAQPTQGVVSGDLSAASRATEQLGNNIARIGEEMLQKRESLAHAKLMNAAGDHELAVAQTQASIKQRVQSGEIPYQQAQQAFAEATATLPLPEVEYARPADTETYGQAVKQINARANIGMQDFVFWQEQQDYKGQFSTFLDTQNKLAGLPNSNVEEINRRIGQTGATLAQKAGINEGQAAKYIQDAKDQNWYNNANEKIIANRSSIDGLKAVENELAAKEGFYQGKLDTQKRDALLNHTVSMRTQLENKLQIQADRQEIKAQRALLEMDAQNSSGVPSTAGQLDVWAQAVKGTPFAEGYNQRIQEEQKIQQVLRLPITDQTQFVQKEQARLSTEGGSLREQANANRLQSAVQKNIAQLQESPLLFAQARTGEAVQPIDFSNLSDPSTQAVLQDRVSTVSALRKQYGGQVQDRPLLPQEAQSLTAQLAKATPTQQGELFRSLSTALGDSNAYRGAMQQIAPDSPVKAQAGVLMGYTGNQTLSTHWLSPNDVVTAQKAATTMLTGENLLNRTAAEGKTDGKPVSLPIPSSEKFATEFQALAGDTFAGRPQAFQAAMQAVRAHYVGTTSEAGDFSQDVNPSRLLNSVKSVLGEVTEYKGHSVLLPWGMDESTFKDNFQGQLSETLKARGLSPQQINQEIIKFPRMDVINYGDDEYLVLDGARRPYLINGQPVSVKLGQ